tara:strand:+ start:94 stop:270 length:177 start_codon:yes stop_codon:yes gene_type:complete
MPKGMGYTPKNGGQKGVPSGAGNIKIMPDNEGTPAHHVGGKPGVKNNKHGRNVSIGKK